MDKTEVLQGLAGLFLIAVLFTPISSDLWIYFLGAGITFGAVWFSRLD